MRASYKFVHDQLLGTAIMLRCAEAAEPGPDRIFCLWSAAGRIDNARRGAKIGGIKLLKRIAILDSLLKAISRNAGSGERIGPAFEDEVLVVSRNMDGKWSERRVPVH